MSREIVIFVVQSTVFQDQRISLVIDAYNDFSKPYVTPTVRTCTKIPFTIYPVADRVIAFGPTGCFYR